MGEAKHTTAAIVLGASGSVGRALVAELVREPGFDPIIVVARRAALEAVAAAREAGKTLRECLVPDMNPAALEAATVEAVQGVGGRSRGSARSASAREPARSR